MLDSLIEKVKQTDSRVWKWILGILIGISVALLVWWLKRQSDKIARLEAEKKLAEERAKDMKVQAENEKDTNLAKALKEEAERLWAQAAEIDTRLIQAKAEAEAAKKRVDDAKTWEELEKEARNR
jgi:hypothetical protein